MSRKSLISLSFAAIAAMLLSSCSPSAYILNLESRAASESGLELASKSIGVVYLESEDGVDSLFNNRVSDALAFALENEYFDGQEAIRVYNLQKDPAGNYSSKDTLSQLILALDKDVIMLLDTPVLADKDSKGRYPVSSKLYVYDSMSDDNVVILNSHTAVLSLSDEDKALSIGTSFSSPFKSSWVREEIPVLYYDFGKGKWLEALGYADDMNWEKAISIWMDSAKDPKPAVASAAKYNIALGCYILGQYELASEWLKSSDESYPLALNQDLRSKIDSRRKK